MQPNPRPPFDQLDTPHGVCVADGWGLKLYVHQGHLIVEDGIGRSRRTRRYHKATSGFSRLVVLGHSGYQTFEAIRWLHDARISLIHIDTDGTVLTTTSQGTNNPALRRAQALAATGQPGIEIMRHLLNAKVRGQRANVQALGEDSDPIDQELQKIQSATSLDDLRQAEMQAAVTYWASWEPISARFVRADENKIPDHWHKLGQRRSSQSASGRRAVNPINAILNYLYALLEGEARIATLAVGLDPGIGILHLDKYARDSFALDLMEAVRPDIDAYVLDLLKGHRFRRSDFTETRAGGCRIARPLSHALSRTAMQWRNHLAEPTERVTRFLAQNPDAEVRNLITP